MKKFLKSDKGGVIVEKSNILNDLAKISSIARIELGNNAQIEEDIARIEAGIKDFKVKVLVVGGFSAGKSSLLNRLLNTNILKEAITPQTAIATELYFGKDEHVVLVKSDGSETKCSFAEADYKNPAEFLKYIYIINNDKLKELDEYVLVDMPGFDSGVEAHNTAILQYIDQGAAYLLVVDAQDGCIKDSAIKFLNEIQLYSEHIGVVLTKSDLKLESEIEDIVKEVEQELNDIIGIMPPLVATSVVDSELDKKVTNVINSFSPQILLENKFGYLIAVLGDEVVNALTEIEATMDLDTQEIDDKIYERDAAKADILKRIDLEKKNLHINLKNNVKPAILEEIETGLRGNIEQLVNAALAGNESLKREVAYIVRPILLQSVQENIGIVVEQLTSTLELGDNNIIDDSESYDVAGTIETIESVATKINTIADKYQQRSQAATTGLNSYRALMVPLAIVTDVVLPWMELIIVFAPDILRFLKGKQSTPEEKIREQLLDNGIPQIINQLRSNIDKNLAVVEGKLITEIEKQYAQKIEIEVAGLKLLKEKKQKTLQDMQAHKEKIKSEINEIEMILKKYKTE